MGYRENMAEWFSKMLAERGDQFAQFYKDLLLGQLDQSNWLYGNKLYPMAERLLGGPEGGGLLEQGLEGIPGFSDATLAAMRGRAIDTVPGQFDTAGQRLKTMLARRGLFGGDQPGSGLAINPLSLLESEKLKTSAGLLRDIDISNEAQMFQNRQQELARRGLALSGLQGGTDLFRALNMNVPAFVTGMGGGLDAFGNAANIMGGIQNPPGFWSKFGPTLIGAGLGAATGGFGLIPGLAGGMKGALGGGWIGAR